MALRSQPSLAGTSAENRMMIDEDDDDYEVDDCRSEMSRLRQMMNGMTCSQRERPMEFRDYAIKNALGKGAYGNVYCVRNHRDGKEYALKQMIICAKNEGIPQSVLREITTMKTMTRKNNINICGLYHVFHQHDPIKGILKINMILEKCDWDLHTFMKDYGRLIPEYMAKHISCQIGKALDLLHSQGIVHRDLKPQNILLNKDHTVKLADFGLSKEHSNTSAFTTLVVTLWYRAPEVLLQSYYNSSVDIWAMGCIISELYNQQPLFPGQDEVHQLTEIFKKMGTPSESAWPKESIVDRKSMPEFKPQRLRVLNRYMSGPAIDLVQQCLHFDHTKRISARDALKHPFLKPSTARRALHPIKLENL